MARPHHVSDKLPLQTFEPLSTTCLACGNPAHIAYYAQRTVTTLTGQHRLHLAVRRCTSSACPRYHLPYRPEAEGAWALPHGEYGLDVIALVGFAARIDDIKAWQKSITACMSGDSQLANEPSSISLHGMRELVTIHIIDRERLQSLVQKQGHLILAVDGLKPDVGARQCSG